MPRIDPPRPRFTLTLEALPADPAGPDIRHTPRRLALVLKDMLRRHGFRCLDIVEVTPLPQPEAKEP